MSGGVDSSVAAAVLAEQGYDLIGMTIKTYRYEDVGGNTGSETSCCSLDGIADARAVAGLLGFPHYVLDFSERFGAEVIADFVAEYLAGHTPNPCVVCNRKIKWEHLLRKALPLGAEAVATGHYARVGYNAEADRYFIARGRDASKDQSYALWGLTQESLRRTLFPLGELTKAEARKLGERYGLPNMQKPESFEICFIPDDDYARFLREQRPDLARALAGGEIVMDGRVVGRHEGYPFYTVGQRRGLGALGPEPVYVTKIDAERNRIEVGRAGDLLAGGLVARDVNLQKYPELRPARAVRACVRYKDEGAEAVAESLPEGRLRVEFSTPRRAITPGQSVVLYEGDDLVGGGVIETAIH